MANPVKWNVSGGEHTAGKGWELSHDYRSKREAEMMARLWLGRRPEWNHVTIRKMERQLWPELGPVWYEVKQYHYSLAETV
jgi:hypothetical protein